MNKSIGRRKQKMTREDVLHDTPCIMFQQKSKFLLRKFKVENPHILHCNPCKNITSYQKNQLRGLVVETFLFQHGFMDVAGENISAYICTLFVPCLIYSESLFIDRSLRIHQIWDCNVIYL